MSSVPFVTFSNPTSNIHSTTITPKLSKDQQAALAALRASQQEQAQYENFARQRWAEAVNLAQAAFSLGEKARHMRRAALVGDIAAGLDQLEAKELQERRKIAEDFMIYQDGVAANSASRGIVGSASSAAAQVAAAQSASRAISTVRANKAATEQQFLRGAIFQAQQDEINYAQDVLSAAGDLSALRHQTRSQIHETRARVRGMEHEANMLRSQFLNMNLQQGIQQFQQTAIQATQNQSSGFSSNVMEALSGTNLNAALSNFFN